MTNSARTDSAGTRKIVCENAAKLYIRDERDLLRHAEYIHWNPVKHGHVARVRDWPYSSFHRYVKQGLCPLDWACRDETSDAADDYGGPR